MCLSEEGPCLHQPCRGINDKAEAFLAGGQRQFAGPATLHHGDCQLRVADDRGVDILFGREQLCSYGASRLMALI